MLGLREPGGEVCGLTKLEELVDVRFDAGTGLGGSNSSTVATAAAVDSCRGASGVARRVSSVELPVGELNDAKLNELNDEPTDDPNDAGAGAAAGPGLASHSTEGTRTFGFPPPPPLAKEGVRSRVYSESEEGPGGSA